MKKSLSLHSRVYVAPVVRPIAFAALDMLAGSPNSNNENIGKDDDDIIDDEGDMDTRRFLWEPES